jgi:hypothetical protein
MVDPPKYKMTAGITDTEIVTGPILRLDPPGLDVA